MKKRGRPTKLNAELTRKICELLRDGISITATCDALGVSESKYFEWLKKGEGGEQPYAKFREESTCARAHGKSRSSGKFWPTKSGERRIVARPLT
jgi:hypothetical protein